MQQQQHFWVWFGCLKTDCPELQFHFPEANNDLRLNHDDFAGLAALISRLSSTQPEHKQIVLFGAYQMQAITRIFFRQLRMFLRVFTMSAYPCDQEGEAPCGNGFADSDGEMHPA